MGTYHKIEKPIVIIVGNSRSGTTMMGWILRNNPEIFTFREIHFFEQVWSTQDRQLIFSNREAINLVSSFIRNQREGRFSKHPLDKYCYEALNFIATLSNGNLTALKLYKEFLFYETKKNGKIIPCEQTPRYVLYIGEILELFPNAKIINMVRDPRDVLLSQKRKWKRRFFDTNAKKRMPLFESFRTWTNYHPITISKLWNVSIKASSKHLNDPRVFSLRFEDLINNPEIQIIRICDFIGISFSQKMLEVPQGGSSNFMNQPLKKGINKGRIGNWKKGGLNSSELYLCQKITGSLMKQNGYAIVNINANCFMLIWYKITFPVKLLMSFMLNLKRMKNIRESIRKRLKS